MDEHKTGFDKPFIKAACTECPQCRKAKQNDWLVRAYFEFRDSAKQAYFVTLDYDDWHLPSFHKIPCFDSRNMSDFLHRMRGHVGKFRYMYSTDYGGFLHRPHYHMMFLLDKPVSDQKFEYAVNRCWYYGSHERIEKLNSVKDDKLKALQYVVKYTTKDVTWDNKPDIPENMPISNRPRVQASRGFGKQALEFGDITLDMVLEGKTVGLPIGKNGKVLPFQIPMYYIYQLGYDRNTVLDEFTGKSKSELVKNDIGIQISKAVHNRRYVYFIKSFFSSRLSGHEMMFHNQKSWYNLVMDTMSDFEDFKEFVYFRDFITHWSESYVCDSITNENRYRPNWTYYAQVLNEYDSWQKEISAAKDNIQTERLLQSAKKRAREDLKRHPQKAAYLRRKHFDFSKLY